MYLAICGPRDMGKSIQTMSVLRETGIRILSIGQGPAVDFCPEDGCHAGIFERLYAETSEGIEHGISAAIFIDSVDRMLEASGLEDGRKHGALYRAMVDKAAGACHPYWARYYGAEACVRVPVVMTCDSLDSLYGTLMTSDVTRTLRWFPETEHVM